MLNQKISLLVPTRDRMQLLQKFVDSVAKMTRNLQNIEIVYICDDDDMRTPKTINNLEQQYPQIAMKTLVRPRSEMLNEDYYNHAARNCSGDLFWILADDLELVSPNWDDTVQIETESFYKKFPDKIICVSMKDNTPPPSHRLPKFPCFPMFTRECLKAQEGWILHPKVPTWGADYVTYCIFYPLGRLLELHNKNYVNHISWHTKQVEVDHINHRIGDIFNRLKMVPHHNTDRIIAEEVPTIRGKISDQGREYAKVNQVPAYC